MLRNRNAPDDVGRLGRSPRVSPHTLRSSAYETPVSPTGVSSFQRRSPVTTISVSRLPQREQTSRFRHSGTGSRAVSSRHFGGIGFNLIAAPLALHDQAHMDQVANLSQHLNRYRPYGLVQSARPIVA